jgi:iron(III) transport system permease protein
LPTAWFDRAILAIAVAAGVYLVLGPLAGLLLSAFRAPRDFLPFESGASFSLQNFVDVYADPSIYSGMLPNTLIFAAGSVSFAFVLALAWSWVLERTDIPFRNLFYVLLLVPFLIPSVVMAIAWVFLLAPGTGLINVILRALFGLTGEGPLSLFTMYGLIFVQGVAQVPFAFMFLSSTFRNMDPVLEEASSISGGRPLATFVRVTLPVLAPGILSTLILLTVLTLEMFDVPLIVGTPAGIRVFSTVLFWRLNPASGLPDYGGVAAIGLGFLCVSLALLHLYNRIVRQAARFATISGKGYHPKRIELGRWKYLVFALLCFYVLVTAVLPPLSLLWTSLVAGYKPISTESIRSLSFAPYLRLFRHRDFFPAVTNTLIVATLSASLAASVSAVIGWVVVRSKSRARHLLDFIAFSSVATPSVVAGVAVMILYLVMPISIYGTLWILVIAYSYRLGVATRITRAGITQIDSVLEEASSVAGASWRATFRRILLPLIAPSFLTSWLLLFITGVREVTLGLLLYNGTVNVTLGVLVWRLYRENFVSETAALSITVAVLILVGAWLMRGVFLKHVRSF